ncbi:MAG: ATP-binding protein [Calditrichia bacterium]
MTIKKRIIWVFTAITALLMIAIALVSYFSIRQIYLTQVTGETAVLTRLVGKQLDQRYLHYLDDPALDRARQIYVDQLKHTIDGLKLSNAFIFDGELKMVLQTNQLSADQHQLILNRTEIDLLAIGESTTTLPFRAGDDLWYLWGFFRLGETHWLGIRQSADQLAEIESLATTFGLIGLTGILLTMLSGWLVARHIAEPIERLIGFSAQLGKGYFDTPLPKNIRGEMAILANALDKMRDGLSANHRERETMLAQIAHEIRNPLGGIELLAGLIREDGDDEYAGKILKEVSTLKGLITAYLNYSRPLKAEPIQTKLAETLEEVFQLCSENATRKGLSLDYQLDVDMVWFDENHLRQILLNLVSNAIEASANGTKISVTAKHATDYIHLVVMDEGPGIEPNELEHIFDPFYTTRAEGTGLGLSVCKRLCNENNAEIRADNRPSGGALFILEISKNAADVQTTKSTHHYATSK